MKITKEFLKEKGACWEMYDWAVNVLKDKPMNTEEFIHTSGLHG